MGRERLIAEVLSQKELATQCAIHRGCHSLVWHGGCVKATPCKFVSDAGFSDACMPARPLPGPAGQPGQDSVALAYAGIQSP